MESKRKKWDDKYRKNNLEKCREAGRNHYKNHIKEQRERSLIKNRKSRKENPEKWKKYNKKSDGKIGRIYSVYKRNAKDRGYKFEVTKEELLSLVEKPCRYCGDTGRGIDRIDNKKGYEKGNICSCCKMCNFMKRAYTEKEFIEHCKKVARLKKCKE